MARRIQNYVVRQLDTSTKIELFVFVVAAIAFYLDRVNLKLYWALRSGGDARAWDFFNEFVKIIYTIGFVTGFGRVHRTRQNSRLHLLLFQPISVRSLVKVTLFDLFIPFLIFYPLWFASLFIFAIKCHLSLQFSFYWFVVNTLMFFLTPSVGIASSVIFRETRACPKNKVRAAGAIAMVAATIYLIFKFDVLAHHYWISVLTTAALLTLAPFLIGDSLAKQFVYSPSHFGAHTKKNGHIIGSWLLKAYLLLVPWSLQSIVRKDSLFALRRYKSFWGIFIFMIVMTTGGMVTISGAKNASSWLLFSNIFAAFLIANVSFKFNLENVELLQIIKSNPIKAIHYWWSKFWVGFTPLLWLFIYGTILFVLRQGMDIAIIAGSLSLSLFFAFTLIFMQNNFSLYSYPYSRYAPLWYNLYIALAVAFFTVFLFPPLTIAFLFFGYYAIFRVLRRFKNLEIF